MATISAPYGFRPAQLLGGQAFAGSSRQYPIASGYNVSLVQGDPVIFVTTGATRGTIARMNATVAPTTVTSSGNMLGVFMGVTYTEPGTLQPTWRQSWVAGTVAPDAVAHVYDDPDGLFRVQADGPVPLTALGTNASMIQTIATNTIFGRSGLTVQASSVAATATLPVRIVAFDTGPTSAPGDLFTDLIVRFNTHFHRQATGVAAT